MADTASIVTSFLTFYYQNLNQNRASLAQLYTPQSTLTFEGSMHTGVDSIRDKLVNMPFQSMQISIDTSDFQQSIPINNQPSIVVHVTGKVAIDNEKPQRFSHVFQLIPNGPSYMILNDIFRFHFGMLM
jgi:hypothetical protein